MTGAATIGIGRSVRAALTFARGGGETVVARQMTPYPFHVTRAFRLDRDRPEIATLYLQSASGGIYRGDDLRLGFVARGGAGAHVTTQSATIVHRCEGSPARQRTTLEIEPGAFLAYTPDPLVLFPGSSLTNDTVVTIAAGARAIVQDGFAWHDPRHRNEPFDRLDQTLEVVGDEGRRLVRERGMLAGVDFLSEASPLGPYKAAGSMLILAPVDVLPVPEDILYACDTAGCLAGIGKLPCSAGLILRCLAPHGGVLRAGLEAAFAGAFAALVGVRPAVRRK